MPAVAPTDALTAPSHSTLHTKTAYEDEVNTFSQQNTFQATTQFDGVPFPGSSGAIDLGSTASQWRIAYLRGLTLGPDSLQDYIIGPRTGDLNISSVGSGTDAREINMATPGSIATGTGDLVLRFNLRAGTPQGQTIINSFESISFPIATAFPGVDATYPGIGRHSAGHLWLRTGAGKVWVDAGSAESFLLGEASGSTGKQLLIGMDTTNNWGQIQAIHQGTGYRPLRLQPDGGEIRLGGSSTKVGVFGVTPVLRVAAYTPTNVTPDRSYNANATTVDELADVLGTLIADLQGYGWLQ